MALTPSTMLELGTKAPDFSLPNTMNSDTLSFADVKDQKGTVIMFICNHCPYVVHIVEGLASLSEDYLDKPIGIAAISSNDVITHPQDSPDNMRVFATENGLYFPYLYDESQQIARAYSAACTPDIFVFDSEDKLVYRGQFDSSRPGNDHPVNGADLRNAMDALLEDKPISPEQVASIGCNIKWK